ncbi:MAG: hypothetical protein Q9159_002004 [Coniocarpon cinnabarinum]
MRFITESSPLMGVLRQLALLSTLGYAASQACDTTNLTTTVPADGTGVANVNYDKIVQLYYTDANDVNSALTVLGLGYASSVPDTNWELWFAGDPYAYLDGVTHLTNITYQATDIGQTYDQQLGQTVTASGPTPTTSTIPAPYASPTGFSQDITDWLAASTGSQAANALSYMFTNIEVPNAANGTVIAAQSYSAPDVSLFLTIILGAANKAASAQQTNFSDLLFRYAGARASEQTVPNQQTGLGEPKFNLDNSLFTGPWGRPQNDGAATSAITLIDFANEYLDAGGDMSQVMNNLYDSDANPAGAPVKKDLLFVANNYSSISFDLWEEEQANHFYTKMVQHRAMVLGSAFATRLGDSATASTLSAAATEIESLLQDFWDPVRGIILYEYGPVAGGKYSYIDSAVLLGVIHGYAGDGVYSYTNDYLLATAVRQATRFKEIYALSATETDAAGLTLAMDIGRYPEDTYNGVESGNQGNPWFLCTAAFAEVFYRASTAFNATGAIAVSDTSKPFWDYFAAGVAPATGTYADGSAEYEGMLAALQGWGDAFLRTYKNYVPEGGHTPEEFNRGTGAPEGAADLTWSYASLLTAAFARAEAIGDAGYVGGIASL